MMHYYVLALAAQSPIFEMQKGIGLGVASRQIFVTSVG